MYGAGIRSFDSFTSRFHTDSEEVHLTVIYHLWNLALHRWVYVYGFDCLFPGDFFLNSTSLTAVA